MAQLPTNRGTTNSRQNHTDDHNELQRLHNTVDSGGGTHGNRPVPHSASGFYFETDTAGGTLFHSDGATPTSWTQWAPGILQRGRGTLDTKVLKVKTIFASGSNDITGWSIAFTYLGLPIVGKVVIPQVFMDTADSRVAVFLVNSATGGVVGGQRVYTVASNSVTPTTNSPSVGAATPDMLNLTLETEPFTTLPDVVNAPVAMVYGTEYTLKVQTNCPTGVTAAAMMSAIHVGFFSLIEP